MYCGTCYKADKDVVFHVNQPEDDEGVVWKRRTDDDKYLVGRLGDNLITPFQCDLCWFRNLKLRSPSLASLPDKRLLAYIRRVNLDALWSRAPGTLSGSVAGIRKILSISEALDIPPCLKPIGPWPVEDNWGFSLGIIIVEASQAPGINSNNYTQYDSIRKIASAYSNNYETTTLAASETWVLKADYSNSYFTHCPTRSEFFSRFKKGLRERMGRDVRGDFPLDYRILHKILFRLKLELLNSEPTFERRR